VDLIRYKRSRSSTCAPHFVSLSNRGLVELPISSQKISNKMISKERPMQMSKYNVAHRLSKRRLLIAINCIAGLSIFFFGYDQ